MGLRHPIYTPIIMGVLKVNEEDAIAVEEIMRVTHPTLDGLRKREFDSEARTSWKIVQLQRKQIMAAAKAKFGPGVTLRLQSTHHGYQLLVGEEGERCYAVEDVYIDDNTNGYDFEERD